jgi:hypothetical protein
MEMGDNITIDLKTIRIGFGDGQRKNPAQNRVQSQAFVLAVLNLRVLLPCCLFAS